MKRALFLTTLMLMSVALLFTGCQQPEIASAKMYISQSNYDKAIEQAKLAIEKYPQNPTAYYILGQAYGNKKMYKEMNEAFDKSLELGPLHTSEIERDRNIHWVSIFNDGVSAINQDKPDEAAELFLLATQTMPDRIGAYKNLAIAYSQLDKNDKAIETYKKAIEIDNSDLEIKHYLGVLYYQNKQYDEAIPVFESVLAEASPEVSFYIEALSYLAYSYDLKGESEKAIAAYKDALSQFPDDKDLIFNLGRLYFLQEKYDMAISTFNDLLALDPDDFQSNLNVGTALLEMEKWEEAVPYLKKASEIKPDNFNAWNNLGIAYVRAGNAEAGKAAFDKAETLDKE